MFTVEKAQKINAWLLRFSIRIRLGFFQNIRLVLNASGVDVVSTIVAKALQIMV